MRTSTFAASFHRAAGLACIGVAGLLALASPADAQKLISRGPTPNDPLLFWEQALAPRNEFFIYNDQDVEIIRFKSPRDVEVCAAPGDPTFIRHPNGFPISVSWGSEMAIIGPGNCLAFDAAQVRVRAASHVPPNIVLKGSFRVLK